MSKMRKSNLNEDAKIFIGGLTRNTTKETLDAHFTKYGQIVDSVVMKNNETGASRGFGFITFADVASAQKALASQNKIDGKAVDVKLCNGRSNTPQQQRGGGGGGASGLGAGMPRQKNEFCKIFVGGLPFGVSDDEIKQFFATRYGPVREFKMIMDEAKQKPKGFGFVTFELEESSNQALMEHYVTFKGKQVEIKPQSRVSSQSQTGFLTGSAGGADLFAATNQWNQWPSSATQQSTQQYLQSQQYAQYSDQYAAAAAATGGLIAPPASVAPSGWQGQASSWQQSGYYAQAGAPINPSAAALNQQSNWNYNYYGQTPQATQQPGAYYQAEDGYTYDGYSAVGGTGAAVAQNVAPIVQSDPYMATRQGYNVTQGQKISNGGGRSSSAGTEQQQQGGGGGGRHRQNKATPSSERKSGYSSGAGGRGGSSSGFGRQQTGGSTSGAGSYHPYRR